MLVETRRSRQQVRCWSCMYRLDELSKLLLRISDKTRPTIIQIGSEQVRKGPVSKWCRRRCIEASYSHSNDCCRSIFQDLRSGQAFSTPIDSVGVASPGFLRDQRRLSCREEFAVIKGRNVDHGLFFKASRCFQTVMYKCVTALLITSYILLSDSVDYLPCSFLSLTKP